MANTTNFGWETPDDTDLVKDGALAMRTLGNAIDTSLIDLKGGTTGQNLRKNSNTDLDFTWAGDATNTVVDAEGDLLVGDSADTLQRLAIGTTGQVLTVDTTVDGKIKWATAASSSGPAFFAYRNGNQTGVTASTFTKVQLNAENFDTDNCFDSTTNYRFTPNKAGYYQINSTLLVRSPGADLDRAIIGIFKNGTEYNRTADLAIDNKTNFHFSGSTLVYLNGTTDYVELFGFGAGSGIEFAGNEVQLTTFSGVWVRS